MTDEKFGVMIVDMQVEYLKEHCPGKILQMVGAQRNLLSASLKFNFPILFAEYAHRGETIPEIKDLARPGENITYIRREFIPNELGNEYAPISDDAFSDSRIECWLRQRSVNSLFGAGINAGACFRATARGGINKGFKVTTSIDLIGSSGLDYILPEDILGMQQEGILVEDFHMKLVDKLSVSAGQQNYSLELYSREFREWEKA